MPQSHSQRLLPPTALETMPIGFIRDTLGPADRTDAVLRPSRPLRRRDQRVHPIAPSTVRRVRSWERDVHDDAFADGQARPRLAESSSAVADVPSRKRLRRPPGATSGPSTAAASGSTPGYTPSERTRMRAIVDRDREQRRENDVRVASRPHTRPPTSDYAEERVALQKGGVKARAREKRAATAHNGVGEGMEEDEPAYSGVLAVAEFERLKKEVDGLKKQLHDAKKTVSKQAKTIEELKKEKEDQTTAITQLNTKIKKSDEVLATFESNLQCLICLDPLLKPYALAPCGHVYCLSCLQDWFRSAPPAEEDMYDSDNVHLLIHRRKTCPSCRGFVHARPAPVFLVKALVVALTSRDGPASPPPALATATATPAADVAPSVPGVPDDPWVGIFYAERGTDSDSSDMEDSSDGVPYEEDEDVELVSDDGDEVEVVSDDDGPGDWGSEYGYGTGSDEEPADGPYVMRRWTPPTVALNPAHHNLAALTAGHRALLSRGATPVMIETYTMRYSHAEGIFVQLGRTTFCPGWSVSLHPADVAGTEYVEWLTRDLAERPERWDVERGPRGRVIARRLVRVGEVEDLYDTTDSEVYPAEFAA